MKKRINFAYTLFSVITLLVISSCVSRDKYNDLHHQNLLLKEQAERASSQNHELQDFVNRHIKEFHEEGTVAIPVFNNTYMPNFVKDSEIRDLRIEINRLRREGDYKARLIEELKTKCGTVEETPTQPKGTVQFSVDSAK
jgi:predicted RNase H-like nuclease (RuvC/YqgF family)